MRRAGFAATRCGRRSRRVFRAVPASAWRRGCGEPLSAGCRGAVVPVSPHISVLRSAQGEAMDFRVLGPVEVRVEGQQLPLGGQRQRALLAYLLLHANEVVSGHRLLDELWVEAP